MKYTIPTEFSVLSTMENYPIEMIHECAEKVAERLTDQEMTWLLASYELHRPKIFKRTITDAVRARDSV